MQDKLKSEAQTTTATQPLFVIGVVLVTLKFANVIDWPWWVVTLPIWIVPLLLLAILAVIFVFATLVAAISCILLLVKELCYTIKTKFRRKS